MNIPLDEWSGAKATKEAQKANAGRERWKLFLTAVAAVAAVIAAWPVVKSWLY